ncbi:hypothetical protein J6T66_06590 [bacterium]|nr:hypothetical protein [bacterium]
MIVFKLVESLEGASKKDDQVFLDLSLCSKDIAEILIKESEKQCKQNPEQEKLTLTFDKQKKDFSEDIYLTLLYHATFRSPVWDYFKYVKRIPNKYSTKDRDRKDSHFIPD